MKVLRLSQNTIIVLAGVILGLMIVAITDTYALDYIVPRQATIAWDAHEIEGVEYRVYVAPQSDKAAATLLGTTSDTTFVVTIPPEIPLAVVGITTVSEGVESDVNWSDVNGTSTPNPWVFILLTPPEGLRIQ